MCVLISLFLGFAGNEVLKVVKPEISLKISQAVSRVHTKIMLTVGSKK